MGETVTDINAILSERQKTHGEFETHAAICQSLKVQMKDSPNWEKLTAPQTESLEMIVHKIARILNGNPNEQDHWADIAGYATLVANRLKFNTVTV